MTDELARKRVQKSKDSNQWTAQDCLEAVLEDIKAGRLDASKLVILAYEEFPDGFHISQYQSGVSFLEFTGMLQLAMIDSTRDFND